MTVTRQKWGKTMASRLIWWDQQKTQGAGRKFAFCDEGQEQ